MYVCLNILNVFVYVIHVYSVHRYECITRVYSLLVDISFSFSFSPIAPYTAPVVTLWCKYIFCIYCMSSIHCFTIHNNACPLNIIFYTKMFNELHNMYVCMYGRMNDIL